VFPPVGSTLTGLMLLADAESRLQRARVSLDGLSLGDAFGERFFAPPDVMIAWLTTRTLPPGPWTWTDDTAMAISLVETLAAHDSIVVDDLARRFAGRYVADMRRGYGGTAHEILQALARGEPWAKISGGVFNGTGSMGNGSAMRVAPLGAYFADDLDRVVEEAVLSAAPTHSHPEGIAGAVAIAVAAAVAFSEGPRGREVLLQEVLARTPAGGTADAIAEAAELDVDMSISTAVNRLGNGSMVICRDTVPLCIWLAARHLDDYVEALWSTVAALGDRDTTCAIVGGIVACASRIPEELLAQREPLDTLGWDF
jgi:ADP-ribosylglycohydrolase